MENEKGTVPLTFESPETGEKIVIGTAQFIDTAKGQMILATVGHNQFEALLDRDDILSLSIDTRFKEKNNEQQT